MISEREANKNKKTRKGKKRKVVERVAGFGGIYINILRVMGFIYLRNWRIDNSPK